MTDTDQGVKSTELAHLTHDEKNWYEVQRSAVTGLWKIQVCEQGRLTTMRLTEKEFETLRWTMNTVWRQWKDLKKHAEKSRSDPKIEHEQAAHT